MTAPNIPHIILSGSLPGFDGKQGHKGSHFFGFFVAVVLLKQPVLQTMTKSCLPWFIDSDVNWLNETSASTRWDVPFHANVLNSIGNASLVMTLALVKEKTMCDAGRSFCNAWTKDVVNPVQHHSLISPGIFLHNILHTFWKSFEFPFCSTFFLSYADKKRGSLVPSAQTASGAETWPIEVFTDLL